MHDLKWIRENPEAFDAGLAKRGLEPMAARLIELDKSRRELQTTLQQNQARRNEAAKAIGAAKGRGEDASDLIDEVSTLKKAVQDGEEEERRLNAEIDDVLLAIPNLPAEDVPVGPDEAANVEIRRIGEPRQFDFDPKEHYDLGEKLGLMDFESAARLSGSRFVVLKGALARMERALAAFMLDIHTEEFGFQEVVPPVLVRDDALYGTGQLPKFDEDLYRTEEGFWLIPTAEVPLTNLVREQILAEDQLPLRFTALTPCFRSEAGSAGRDTRGMLRQHQFSKVEMVAITAADRSEEELERMTGCAEEILKRLELPYRVMKLSSGDMGFSARRTYDLEVWLPGQDMYREISSCSVCGDFQARRMKARYRREGEKGTQFLHTLNGSGLAVGRTLIAVLENYQQADGSIEIPKALQLYMGGLARIEAAGK